MNKKQWVKHEKAQRTALGVAKELDVMDYIQLHLEAKLGRHYEVEDLCNDVDFSKAVSQIQFNISEILYKEKKGLE